MERLNRNVGNVTPLVLTVITGLSLVAMSLVPLVMTADRRAAAGEAEARQKKDLDLLLEAVINGLKDDDTPENDKPNDLVRVQLMEWELKGFEIQLEDGSSRLGMNWVRKEMLEKAGFLTVNIPGDEFQQKRYDLKLPGNPDFLYEWLPPEDVSRYFSENSYFNVNISDEFSLQQLYAQILGLNEGGGEEFRAAVQQTRIADEEGDVHYLDTDGLKEIAGEDFERIFPVINTLPVMNLHYTESEIIELVIKHHNLDKDLVSSLINEQSPDENSLRSLLADAYDISILPHYFGVKTWFWNLSALHPEGLTLKAVIACIPLEDEDYEYRIVGKMYE